MREEVLNRVQPLDTWDTKRDFLCCTPDDSYRLPILPSTLHPDLLHTSLLFNRIFPISFGSTQRGSTVSFCVSSVLKLALLTPGFPFAHLYSRCNYHLIFTLLRIWSIPTYGPSATFSSCWIHKSVPFCALCVFYSCFTTLLRFWLYNKQSLLSYVLTQGSFILLFLVSNSVWIPLLSVFFGPCAFRPPLEYDMNPLHSSILDKVDALREHYRFPKEGDQIQRLHLVAYGRTMILLKFMKT